MTGPEKGFTQQVSVVSPRPALPRRATSIGSTTISDPAFEIDWEDDDDPQNPRNWPTWYKGLAIGFISWGTWV